MASKSKGTAGQKPASETRTAGTWVVKLKNGDQRRLPGTVMYRWPDHSYTFTRGTRTVFDAPPGEVSHAWLDEPCEPEAASQDRGPAETDRAK